MTTIRIHLVQRMRHLHWARWLWLLLAGAIALLVHDIKTPWLAFSLAFLGWAATNATTRSGRFVIPMPALPLSLQTRLIAEAFPIVAGVAVSRLVAALVWHSTPSDCLLGTVQLLAILVPAFMLMSQPSSRPEPPLIRPFWALAIVMYSVWWLEPAVGPTPTRWIVLAGTWGFALATSASASHRSLVRRGPTDYWSGFPGRKRPERRIEIGEPREPPRRPLLRDLVVGPLRTVPWTWVLKVTLIFVALALLGVLRRIPFSMAVYAIFMPFGWALLHPLGVSFRVAGRPRHRDGHVAAAWSMLPVPHRALVRGLVAHGLLYGTTAAALTWLGALLVSVATQGTEIVAAGPAFSSGLWTAIGFWTCVPSVASALASAALGYRLFFVLSVVFAFCAPLAFYAIARAPIPRAVVAALVLVVVSLPALRLLLSPPARVATRG